MTFAIDHVTVEVHYPLFLPNSLDFVNRTLHVFQHCQPVWVWVSTGMKTCQTVVASAGISGYFWIPGIAEHPDGIVGSLSIYEVVKHDPPGMN